MNKKLLIAAIVITSLALTALLAYSIERTAWLFGRFETWTPAAYAAAVVVELAAVALIVGASALAHLDRAARAWANRALLAVLSVGALANLAAGYLRGGRGLRDLFAPGEGWATYMVAAALWFVSNLAVPGLILCLSKLLERLAVALAAGSAEPLRARLDRVRRVSAQRRMLIGRLTSLVRSLRGKAERIDNALRTQIDEQHQEIVRLRDLAAAKSAEVEAQSAAASLDVRTVAQRLRDGGVPLRTIGSALGVSEKTIRNWTMDVRTNGHAAKGD